MKKHYRSETNCLNCGHVVELSYCSNCGQENVELKEPFWHFIGHSISHYFHFDSKFFHTLKPLLTEPGRLTLEYLNGRRTRFLHPVSMYIFVSIVYFLIVPPLSQSPDDSEENIAQEHAAEKNAIPAIGSDTTLFQETLQKATIKLRASQFENLSYKEQELYLDSLKNIVQNKSAGLQKLVTRLEKAHEARRDSTYEAYLSRQDALPESLQDSRIEKYLKKREIAIAQKTSGNWSISNEVQKYNPKLYFLLMPLFAFFLMLNFRRNKKYYVEHLIFTIHFFTAFFIFSIITSPIDHFIFKNDSYLYDLAELMVILWYIYTALKIFYQRKKWTTIRKIFSLSILLMTAYSICYGIIYSIVYLTA